MTASATDARYGKLDRVLAPARRRRLLDELGRHGSAQVAELAHALGVSPSTVRRDLAELESDGLLRRAHGGAYLDGVATPAPRVQAGDGDAAKLRIGRAAAGLIDDDMTVMILSGTTTQAMLSHLATRSITVVTNGLAIATALADYPGITLVMLGGILHRNQMTLLGPMTEQNMADLHVDVLFAGAYGITPRVGVTGAKIVQAGYHHSMLRHTDSLVVLADATKFGRRGPTLLADIDQVDTFVTDEDAPTGVLDELRDGGASITVC